METTIIAFAWIGLIGVGLLGAATLFVWAVAIWEKLVEAPTRALGIFYASTFYVSVRFRTKGINPKTAGMLLFARYERFAAEEPEIAREFEDHIEHYRLSRRTDRVGTA